MTIAVEGEVKTEQAVKPGEDEVVNEAGEVSDAVDTAATEKTSDDDTVEADEFSIDAIGSEEELPKKEDDVLKLDGVSEKAQERINSKIGTAHKEKKLAQEETKKANARIAELEAELVQKAAPTERPLAPLREDYETGQEYQEAMNKYQDDTIAYNAAANLTKTQEETEKKRNAENDTRLITQMDELQKRFPDINVHELIQSTDYGNAQSFIVDSEHSARIGLFLAKNEGELARIGSLTDAGAINREIGKLEERFTSARKKTTKAPKPLNTVSGNTGTVAKDIDDIEDDDEWFREHKKQEALKLKSKQ